jgi:uncharacterized protein YjiS (DUF1127 family)
MSTTLFRSSLPAAMVAAVNAAGRALRRLLRPSRRRRMEHLNGLSDHILRDIGLERRGAPPFRPRG